jgi:hypothetical protein
LQAKALAEKNERDLQVQWEQEERHRIGETLDFEIKRWAAGKEGNLRALLSTLQYVSMLFPVSVSSFDSFRPCSVPWDLIPKWNISREGLSESLSFHSIPVGDEFP